MNGIEFADTLAGLLAGATADGSIAMLSLMLGMLFAWRWIVRSEARAPRRQPVRVTRDERSTGPRRHRDWPVH